MSPMSVACTHESRVVGTATWSRLRAFGGSVVPSLVDRQGRCAPLRGASVASLTADVAARHQPLWPNAEQLARAFRTLLRKVKCGAVMRACQSTIEPAEQLLCRCDPRHALVFDRREDGPADQDLSPGIALALGLIRTCQQSTLLTAETGQPFFERVNAGAYFV